MVKYIVFDFDGTLADSMGIGVKVFNQMADKYGFKKLKDGNIEELRGLSVIEKCKAVNVPIYRLPFLALEFQRIFKESLSELRLFDGIRNMLTSLEEKGYKLAIISSNAEENIREFLEGEGILDSIEEIFSSNNIFGKDKVIKKFLKKNKLNSSEIIYVGDEERDIQACKKIGVEIIWVSWGFDLLKAVEKENPDYIVHNPSQILDIV
ncbi:HAD-IA family hydrolase [Halonatronum saccharophilum]|uniref:HAD-IA family hydrolase n=1 Tax=Halonatronum saccharophilum TaxID=150060 RepID=UPI0004821C90|nr:HAD-IA family hydrolase [Halonatronum saccharophilum]